MAAIGRIYRAHWDGHCFVPDEPVDLPIGTEVLVSVVGANRTGAEERRKSPGRGRTDPTAPPDQAPGS